MKSKPQPVMLLVLDGWGHTEQTNFNAIHAANTPVWDELIAKYPNSVISCSGSAVGLPDKQMGNSEVGHMHLGAGRTIYQDFTRISNAISDGNFRKNPTLVDAFRKAADNGKAVHIMGLLSPGGVHSHEDHIVALMELAKEYNVPRLFVHGFLDGRDTPPKSAAESIEKINTFGTNQNLGFLATICGRYYAMDRNKNWDRIKLAYDLIIDGEAEFVFNDARAALDAAYARGETDEFVKPSAILDSQDARVIVEDGDVIVFANFRADRARQLTEAICSDSFTGHDRCRVPVIGKFVTMTQYSEDFHLPIAFPPFELNNTFGQIIADNELHQLRIAETEKYAHVTFFFNGGVEKVFDKEDRILIPSPDVATYDLKPEMSASEVTDALVECLAAGKYDAIICNYANADMVGHTGNFDATVACIEALDACLGRVIAAARQANVEVLITADHGNAEKMRADETSDVAHTAHTSNLVPLIYVGRVGKIVDGGCLSDIAPTLLSLMGLEKPEEMTGRCLIELLDKQQDAA
ncbi:MAG: 2,3-bisphosphoglycerate-independent phosphoglycerate mutase [Gammaproteobacteria bacterium]